MCVFIDFFDYILHIAGLCSTQLLFRLLKCVEYFKHPIHSVTEGRLKYYIQSTNERISNKRLTVKQQN